MSNKSNISDAVISLSNIGDKEDENRRNPSEGSHKESPDYLPKKQPEKSEWAPPITRLGIDIYGDKERIKEIIRLGTESVCVGAFHTAKSYSIQVDDNELGWHIRFLVSIPGVCDKIQCVETSISYSSDILELICAIQGYVASNFKAIQKKMDIKHYDYMLDLPVRSYIKICYIDY